MRLRPMMVFALMCISTSGAALADVGPAPTCPAGQKPIYNMGHKCVPDDSAPIPATPSAAPSAASTAPTAPAEQAEKVEPKSGCGCSSASRSPSALAVLGVGIAALLLRRRTAARRS